VSNTCFGNSGSSAGYRGEEDARSFRYRRAWAGHGPCRISRVIRRPTRSVEHCHHAHLHRRNRWNPGSIVRSANRFIVQGCPCSSTMSTTSLGQVFRVPQIFWVATCSSAVLTRSRIFSRDRSGCRRVTRHAPSSRVCFPEEMAPLTMAIPEVPVVLSVRGTVMANCPGPGVSKQAQNSQSINTSCFTRLMVSSSPSVVMQAAWQGRARISGRVHGAVGRRGDQSESSCEVLDDVATLVKRAPYVTVMLPLRRFTFCYRRAGQRHR